VQRSLTVRLYATGWNEEKMLPYFFPHYDTLVSRYFVFDDGFTDRSVDLLNAHPKVAGYRGDSTKSAEVLYSD
jgi:hypothetical protein